MKTILLLSVILSVCSGCGSDSTAGSASKHSPDSGTYTVKVDGVVIFDHNSDRAAVRFAKDNVIGFKASGYSVRVMGNQLPDTGEAMTNDLNRNNLMFHTYATIDGNKTRVGCDPAKNPKGFFQRTELTETHISGKFSAEFVACDDYFTGKPVAYPDKPFVVTGTFNQVKLK